LPVHASPGTVGTVATVATVGTVGTVGTTIEILPTIDGRAEMPSE
jgi:hypothetical protein